MSAFSGRNEGEPETVVVFGSGNDIVNGTYHFAGRLNDKPKYEMQKMIEGKAMTCQLESLLRPRDSWVIKVDDKNQFRCSTVASDEPHLPTCRGWWFVNCIRPPIVLYSDENIIDWRQDPEHSLADYRVDVVYDRNGTTITTTYHCHRVILSNSSKYFSRLFKGNAKGGPAFVESKENASKIDLNASVAEIFPYFLDYMYWHFSDKGRSHHHLSPVLHQQNIGLYWLADYFEVSKLKRDRDHFLATELDVHYSSGYLKYALELGIQHIVDAIILYCSEHLIQLEDETEDEREDEDWVFEAHAKVFDAACLLSVLEKKKPEVRVSLKASKLVAQFCDVHDVDAETFQTLTEYGLLPVIDSGAALQLLEKERALLATPDTAISNLQERCIDALACDFIQLDTIEESLLQQQSTAFLARLIVKAREHLKDSMEE
jgi:hypothetical protein